MNPFMLSADDRLEAWSSFRDGLNAFSEQEQINLVAQFWAQCPLSRWSLDPDTPKSWQTVWEMLDEGDYCKNAVAIAMETTLRLSGWDASRLKLVMIRRLYDGDRFFVVIIDDTVVLNYSSGETVNVADIEVEFVTQYAFKFEGRQYKDAV